jgi:hypothetical protein
LDGKEGTQASEDSPVLIVDGMDPDHVDGYRGTLSVAGVEIVDDTNQMQQPVESRCKSAQKGRTFHIAMKFVSGTGTLEVAVVDNAQMESI